MHLKSTKKNDAENICTIASCIRFTHMGLVTEILAEHSGRDRSGNVWLQQKKNVRAFLKIHLFDKCTQTVVREQMLRTNRTKEN